AAAGRDAGPLAGGPARRRVPPGADRPPGGPRRRAAPGPAAGGALPVRRRDAPLPGRRPVGRRVDDVLRRDGRRGGELPGGAGRRGPRLVLGVVHHVLPRTGARRAGPAGRLAPDGLGRGRPPRRATTRPPAPQPRRLPGTPVICTRAAATPRPPRGRCQ